MSDMPEDLQLFIDAERLVCRLYDLRYTDYSRFKTDRVQRLLMLANRRADRRFFLFDIPSYEHWNSFCGMSTENRPAYDYFSISPSGTAAENRPATPDLTPQGEGGNSFELHELPF